MAPVTTRVPAAQDGLKAILSGAGITCVERNTGGVYPMAVTLGWPAKGLDAEHLQVMGEVLDWHREWETTATTQGYTPPQYESFTLIVRTRTFLEGLDDGSFKAVRDRHFTVLAAVEIAIRADFTLGGAVDISVVGDAETHEGIADNGRELMSEHRITCQASLTG